MKQEVNPTTAWLPASHLKKVIVDKMKPSLVTGLAFVLLVILVGANVVAVRFVNRELPPFWGAGTRFLCASALFFVFVLARRLPLPHGRALVGVLLFGLLQFGLGYALGYWALQRVPAGLASVILASIPLFTLVFAFVTCLEPFRLRGLAGSLMAVAGIAALVGEQAGKDVPLAYLLAMVGMALTFAWAPVIVKSFPAVHLAVANGVGMLTGACLLMVLSLLNNEGMVYPHDPATWGAFLYLVLPGSIGVFALLIWILKRWTATTVSYQNVLSPLVSVALSSAFLGERLTRGLFLGGVLVLVGVYIGALGRHAHS